eukprot:CAMPEP_0175000146 /NCGR_PEP_ID=MMETSP0005-20121125/2433_1 /TAXON_ID=420556 /ORGANISM="Ochromonas sp., Strain CCMP1393" /LENGTH=422 /DNA_ID=CAMNT_0016254923 /DNA_START=370 /DNA_END=1638 /DNA_ORIENTATION=-
MHFAICAWGIVRSLRFTINSIHSHCLDPISNAGHTFEIFMHTYKFSGNYHNARSNEVGVTLNFSEWKILQPDHIYVEDQDVFDRSWNLSDYTSLGDPWHNSFVSFTNHMRALNSIHYLANAVEIAAQTRQFDGMIYMRPDIMYLNEVPFYLMEHIPNTLFLPDFHRSCRGGQYNDRFAMGDLKSALTYGKRFESALEYSRKKPLHSETFLYDVLQTNNVSVMEIPFRFRRTRATGDYHVRDDHAIVSPRLQTPEPPKKTGFVLRTIYSTIESFTNNEVYIWNHDDNENLYCKPNPYLSLDDCHNYRKISRQSAQMKLQQELRQRVLEDPSLSFSTDNTEPATASDPHHRLPYDAVSDTTEAEEKEKEEEEEDHKQPMGEYHSKYVPDGIERNKQLRVYLRGSTSNNSSKSSSSSEGSNSSTI